MRRLRRGPGEQHDPGRRDAPATAATATTATRDRDAGDHRDHRDAGRTATTSKPASGSVTTRGSNGRMYHCVGPALLRDLRTLSRRIDRGRRSLRRIRSELRRLKRRYPSKVAPPRVAQRYNYLVRKHNALLRLGNRRVRAYNQRLERDCTRG